MSRLVEMSVTSAVDCMWGKLSSGEKHQVAGELGVPYSTVDQWGKFSDDGVTPRMRIPADMVSRFCAACGDALLADVIAHRTAKELGHLDAIEGEVSQLKVISEVEEPLRRVINALEDGRIDNAEARGILKELNEAAEVVQAFRKNGRRRGPSNVQAFEALSIREAEEASRR